MHLNEKYLTNATDGLTELKWLVSSAEQKSELAHKNLVSDKIYHTEILRHLPSPICFFVLPFFLPFYEKPLKTVGISIFHTIYQIVKKGIDCVIP